MKVSVQSEIEDLNVVLIHYPGYEHRKILPWNMRGMLFDDILDVEEAQPEHDNFVFEMRNHDVDVLYLTDLLKEVFNRSFDEAVEDILLNEELVEIWKDNGLGINELLWGYPQYLKPETDMVWPPLPNLYFTRDPAFVLGQSIVISNPRYPARRRESRIMATIFKKHRLFSGVSVYDELLNTECYIEGGDVHVIDQDSLMIGIGQRTNELGMQHLKDYAFERCGFERVFAVSIPAKRQFMHLDTVLTFTDYKQILTLPYIWSEPRLYGKLAESSKRHCEQMNTKYDGPDPDFFDQKGMLRVFTKGKDDPDEYHDVLEGLEKHGKIDRRKTIYVAGRKEMYEEPYFHISEALREQWNDAANVLAIMPGWVLTYRRNDRTRRALEYAGIRTVPFNGGDLVRGRGGARCMSMPLRRGDS